MRAIVKRFFAMSQVERDVILKESLACLRLWQGRLVSIQHSA